ncbi:MAG: hypothetical protein KDD25_01185 [Bdellovibrionales bacterium]|nr:hypothetical protein [Bdellovibrionales bacterium]
MRVFWAVFLLVISTFSFQFAEASWIECALNLGAKFDKVVPFATRDRIPLIPPSVLLSAGHSEPNPDFSFVVSNETNFYLREVETEPTDMLIGFGTNSAWDLAVRKNAKHLVVGDWSIIPLIFQWHLFRPLAEVSRTPAEFLSLLGGQVLPESDSLKTVFAAFKNEIPMDYVNEFIQTATRKILSHPKNSGEFTAFIVRNYYANLFKLGPPLFEHRRLQNIFSGIFGYFKRRYDPNLLIEFGADPAIVNHPYFSFLSSQSAFDRFKRLITGALTLVHMPYDDPDMISALEVIARDRGFERTTYSLSNIIDVSTNLDPSLGSERFAKFAQMVFNIRGTRPFQIFQTRSNRDPYGYQQFTIGSVSDIESAAIQHFENTPSPLVQIGR